MKAQSNKFKYLLDSSIAIFVLAVLLFYTYVYVVTIPYLGFNFILDSGMVTQITTQNYPPNTLLVGDIIRNIGRFSWSDYTARKPGTNLETNLTNHQVELTIERMGKTLQIQWTLPGSNRGEISSRIFSSLWLLLPYLFWLAGALTLFSVRPRDQRRNLLAAFNFLISVWTITGYQSDWNYYFSSDLFHTALWIFWPVSWQLHWVFPHPLQRINRWIWIALYCAASVGIIIDFLYVLKFNLYPIPLILAAVGSLFFLGLHFLLQPGYRRQVSIVLIGLFIAVLPGILRILIPAPQIDPHLYLSFAYWSLIIIPPLYFYAIYYRQLGSLELRASSTLSLLFYCVFVFLIGYITIYLLASQWDLLYTPTTTILFVALQTTVFTIIFYPYLRRGIERYVLGITVAPQNILTTYSSQIITARDSDQLVKLIREQILPSMMIRQAVLLQIHLLEQHQQNPVVETIFRMNISSDQIPNPEDLPVLLGQSGKYIPPSKTLACESIAWVRLPLAKTIDADWFILLLLGQRDPDDYYAQGEIKILQAMVDNTALAFVNLEQNRLLHTLYQVDIEREEQERTRLALELHDDVLHQLALLAQSVEDIRDNQAFFCAYQASVQRVREMIGGLRPPMLNFGLSTAIDGLADEIMTQATNGTTFTLDIPASTIRYPPDVELHLFRIVQQACVNAIKHGKAQHITLQGELIPGKATLIVTDDGIGLDGQSAIDLNWLLANKHFGLAGMFERAALIKAQLQIDSRTDHGTQIRVSWTAPETSSVSS